MDLILWRHAEAVDVAPPAADDLSATEIRAVLGDPALPRHNKESRFRAWYPRWDEALFEQAAAHGEHGALQPIGWRRRQHRVTRRGAGGRCSGVVAADGAGADARDYRQRRHHQSC